MELIKDIYWEKLTTFEKVIFVLGWLSAISLVFWLIFLIVYVVKKDQGKKYKEFFNPYTFRVPFIFGWINLIVFGVMLVIMLFIFLFVFALAV